MRTATELIADVVNVRAHVKSLAANNAKIDFREPDLIDSVTIHVDEPRLALNDLALPRQFIKGDTSVLFR